MQGSRRFQGLLLRFDIAADTDLRLQLAVQKRAAHLLDRDHVGAGALRTNPGGHGQGTVDVKPLAAVSWIVNVGQILPGDLTELRSDFQINLGSNTGSDRFDQVAVDGSGRLFATVNNGTILFMNYNFTGEVGSPANFVTTQFVQPFLTGVALVPNQGGGDGGIPLPAAAWTGFGMFTILALSKTCFRKWPALHSACPSQG